MQSWLGQWTALASKIPEGVTLAALLLPVVLAIFSRQFIVILGSLLLAATCLCALVAPANITVTLATSLYLGSLLTALSEIVARQKAKALQSEFAQLREDVERLLNDEQKRFLKQLKSSKKETSDRLSQ